MKRTWIAVTVLTICVLVLAVIATRRPAIVAPSPVAKVVNAEPKEDSLEFRLSEGVASEAPAFSPTSSMPRAITPGFPPATT